MANAKKLVAYFSCSGVTKRAAETIAHTAGAGLFEVEPGQPYTAADLNWMDKKSRSTLEMQDASSRPAIAHTVPDMAAYDTVFVGFPNWWGVAPRIIETFLESYDFSGKTVVPFFTSGGSGAGKTDSVLHGCCSPETAWKPCKRIASLGEVEGWVASLGV